MPQSSPQSWPLLLTMLSIIMIFMVACLPFSPTIKTIKENKMTSIFKKKWRW